MIDFFNCTTNVRDNTIKKTPSFDKRRTGLDWRYFPPVPGFVDVVDLGGVP